MKPVAAAILRRPPAGKPRRESRANPTATVAAAATAPSRIAPAAAEVLIEHRARFLAFLERRVGGRELAEEILQQAYLRGIARGGALRAGESAVAWFYRLLRSVLADHFRRRDAERRALEAMARAGPPPPGAM